MTDLHQQTVIAAEMAMAVYWNESDWLVHEEDGITYVAIEGTDSLIDWRRNCEFLITSSSEHLGFGAYARQLTTEMWASGVSLDPAQQTIICGHSLGGAVATIIAAQLQDHLPLLRLITFGSPRPGGRRFRERLKVPHMRYVHGEDVVPHMPMALLGFRHAGPATELKEPHGWGLHGISDHSMTSYKRLVV
jgi:pimeloyl-ACP methyl ester carboxylesterase